MSDAQAAEQGDGTDPIAAMRSEISEEMVRLYKELFGRGPRKVWTDFAGPDAILCTFEGSLTLAERRLAEMGEHQRLRDTRLYFQYATEGEFCGAIERITKRKVRAFNSGTDTVKDVSSEVYYLEPFADSPQEAG
jgi:uncharacterized protein YbcI